MHNLVALMGYGAIATKKVFEWTCAVPDVVRAGAQIGRFLNDISSYKVLRLLCISELMLHFCQKTNRNMIKCTIITTDIVDVNVVGEEQEGRG